MKTYVLYNPYSGNKKGREEAEALNALLTEEELVFSDVTKLDGYEAFFDALSEADKAIVCGGDGTLNRFVNDVKGLEIKPELWYYPCGSGNDFAREVGGGSGEKLIPLAEEYIKDLPTVTVNGKERVFLNGVGYGIDGYCCEVGDTLRERSDKPVNYTGIAIKGLLFGYKPTNATVIVDGKEYTFKKVWIAPTMNGKYYGGGMIPTPEQKRNSDKLSVMIFHGSGKLKTLMIFPSLFKGEHVKEEKYVSVLTGNTITVKFDEPRPLQIDGETVLGVAEYTAKK